MKISENRKSLLRVAGEIAARLDAAGEHALAFRLRKDPKFKFIAEGIEALSLKKAQGVRP